MSNAPHQAQDWPLVLRCGPEEARRIAEAAPFRYEYAHGVLRAMAGGTLAHSRMIINLLSLLAAHLGDGPCRVFDGNVELHFSHDEYRFPDAFVTCDDLHDAYATKLFDATLVCFLAAVAAKSTDPSAIKAQVRAVTGPPGEKFNFTRLADAIKALQGGQKIDFEGVSGPLDLDKNGDPTTSLYDIFQFKNGRLEVIRQVEAKKGQ